MRRGSSGAEIILLDDRVVKQASDKSDGVRLIDQASWLQKHESPLLPRVFQVYARSYVMERLAVPPLRLLNRYETIREIVTRLEWHVWCHSALAPLNHDMLRAKLTDLIETYDFQHIWGQIFRMTTHIRWNELRTCLTHGDPTLDNLMIRESTGEVVLIDPIPATLVIPDLWSVDLGKIIQSLLGWEAARYDDSSLAFSMHPDTFLDMVGASDNERQAAIFWSVVHLLRTLPYVDDRVRGEVRKLVSGALTLL